MESVVVSIGGLKFIRIGMVVDGRVAVKTNIDLLETEINAMSAIFMMIISITLYMLQHLKFLQLEEI